MKKTILVYCIALMTLAGLYAKEIVPASSKEETADIALLRISNDGTLIEVTDKTKLKGKLVLPAEVKKIDVTAFSGCTGLTSIDLSACTGLTEIAGVQFHGGAFSGCTGLTEVRLPASLTKIESEVFGGCRGLTKIDLSGCTSLTEIGSHAFRGCTGLTSIDLSGCTSLTEIGKGTFSGCTGLTSIDLSSCTGLTQIDVGAFYSCTGLREVRLPVCLAKMSGSVFNGCSNLRTLTVDPANTTYCSKDNVLYTKDMKTLVCATKNITHISIPDTITEIGWSAFYDCTGLTNVDLSACIGLTEIGGNAFSGCTGLTNVDLSACIGLTEIGGNAFSGCTSLTNVDLSGCTGLTKIDEWAFWNISPDARFTVPTEAVKELLKGSGINDEQITVKNSK